MTCYQAIFTGYIGLINLLAYVLMVYDKFQSKQKGSRISEKCLFLFALAMGAPGIYLGMKAPLYHKSAKPAFRTGIPLIIILNLVIGVYVIYKIR